MMKRIITVLLLLCPLSLFAQGGADALPFVRTDFGPSLTGTAGACVASSELGVWGAFRGAAAMAFPGSRQGVAGEFRTSAGNPGFSAAGMAKLMNKIGVGVGVSYLGGEEFGDYRSHDILLSSGFAYSITENLAVGLNARFAKQFLTESISYQGAGIDINVLAKVSYAITATAGLSAVGSSVVSATGTKYSQPANVYAGAEYVIGFDSNKLALDAMAEYYFSGNFGAALGAAFTYEEMVTLRAGYRYATEWCVLPSHFAAGLEGRFHGFSVNVSFAKLPSSNIICVGAGFSF